MMKKLGLGGAALAAILFVLPSSAAAQGYPPPPPGGGGGAGMGPPPAPAGPTQDERGFWPRYGIYGGVGLGGGNMTLEPDGCPECEDSKSGFSFHFNIGYRLNPQLGVFLDGWGMASQDDEFVDVTYVHAIGTVGVQYHFTPMLYGRFGLGSAQFSVNVDGIEEEATETVPGFMAGAGFEALHSPNLSVDVELRVGSGFYDDGTLTNAALAVSVNWHQLWLRPPPIQ